MRRKEGNLLRKLKVGIKEKKSDYEIIIGENIIKKLKDYIEQVYKGKKVFLLSDQNVMSLYGEKITEILTDAHYDYTTFIIPPGEGSKNFDFLLKGYDLLLKEGFGRDNLLLALGGGVVGDLAGFLAATFMRGIAFVQIPTSLLAQVDSSIGGKTAVNHPLGKNLIGAFYQPELVLIDTYFLKTLDRRELVNGLAEIIKYGFIADRGLLTYLEENREAILNYDTEALGDIIYTSCKIKAKVVEEDEKEKGKRAILNFGHTIGHALEAVTDYEKYHHGEAVAVGMAAAAEISRKLSLISKEDRDYLEKMIGDYGLPVTFQYGENSTEVYERLFYDKKAKDGQLRWVLLKEPGEAYIEEELSKDIIMEVLEGLR
jgi:3-dehydroquinate synthase